MSASGLRRGKWQPHATQLSSPPYVRECALGEESAGLTPKVYYTQVPVWWTFCSAGEFDGPKMEEEVERKGLGNLNCFDKGREKIASVLA